MHEIADIACNFTSDRFDNDLDEVINQAIVNNITTVSYTHLTLPTSYAV